ncbi:MAG: hypothetical protein LUH04_11980, partial [Clostridium sp.]|nr:hypothetical protein [Clostridium sp.]
FFSPQVEQTGFIRVSQPTSLHPDCIFTEIRNTVNTFWTEMTDSVFPVKVIAVESIYLKDQSKIRYLSDSIRRNFFPQYNPKNSPIILLSSIHVNDIHDTFFSNTNIWFRYLQSQPNIREELNRILPYYRKCNDIGLYGHPSAWEYMDYHLRIQKENYVSGDHKRAVVPNVYGKEEWPEENEPIKDSEPYLRMLLIDDKTGKAESKKIKNKRRTREVKLIQCENDCIPCNEEKATKKRTMQTQNNKRNIKIHP